MEAINHNILLISLPIGFYWKEVLGIPLETRAYTMEQKNIHPTTHAIERFEQRVLPHLPDDSRTRMQNKDRIRQSLYGLVRRAEIEGASNQLLHVQAFFTVQGYPPIPLTIVIDPVKRTLCTLYISPGWQNVGSNDNPRWVWCL